MKSALQNDDDDDVKALSFIPRRHRRDGGTIRLEVGLKISIDNQRENEQQQQQRMQGQKEKFGRPFNCSPHFFPLLEIFQKLGSSIHLLCKFINDAMID